MRNVALGALGLLFSCTSADVLRVDRTPRPVVAAQVPVLLDEPADSYRTIALVEVSGSWGASLERMGKRLSAEAAKLGGHAVLLTRRSAQSGSALIPVGSALIPIETEDSRLVGKVIIYRDRLAAEVP